MLHSYTVSDVQAIVVGAFLMCDACGSYGAKRVCASSEESVPDDRLSCITHVLQQRGESARVGIPIAERPRAWTVRAD
eukprot:4614794-Amphidinium_carterae.3